MVVKDFLLFFSRFDNRHIIVCIKLTNIGDIDHKFANELKRLPSPSAFNDVTAVLPFVAVTSSTESQHHCCCFLAKKIAKYRWLT